MSLVFFSLRKEEDSIADRGGGKREKGNSEAEAFHVLLKMNFNRKYGREPVVGPLKGGQIAIKVTVWNA